MVSLSAVAPMMGLPSFNHWMDNGGVPMNSAEKVVASPAPTLRSGGCDGSVKTAGYCVAASNDMPNTSSAVSPLV